MPDQPASFFVVGAALDHFFDGPRLMLPQDVFSQVIVFGGEDDEAETPRASKPELGTTSGFETGRRR